MSKRIGICDKCGQRYGDIPDSVTALKVKCQVCDGAVAIPPLPATSAPTPAEPTAEAPAPSAPAVDSPDMEKPLAAPLGGARPKTERPDKAKSIDRDIAAPAAPEAPKETTPVKPMAQPMVPMKPVGKPVAPVKPVKPVGKPVVPVKPIKPIAKPVAPVKSVAKAPAPKTAPPKPAAKAPAQATSKPSAADIIAKAKAKRVAEPTAAAPAKKASAADIIAKAKAKRADETAPAPKESAADIIARAKSKRTAPATAAPAAKGANAPTTERDSRLPKASGTRRPSGGRKSSGSSSRARRRHEEEEEVVEKSKVPMVIAAVVVLAAIGGGAWWALRPDAEPIEQGETVEVPADTTPAAAANQVPEANEVLPAASEATEVQPAAATADSADASAAGAEAADTTPAPVVVAAAGKDWQVPAIGEPIATRGVTDYKIIHLDQVPPLKKWSGTNEEEWVEIQDDLLLFLDDSGAQSNRAGRRLVADYPRGAYPAIVNAMMKINFDDKDDMFIASTLNELLIKVGKGTNYGWDSVSGMEPGSDEWAKAALLDKKIVGTWHTLWVNKFAEDDTAWANFASSAADKKAAEDKAAKPSGDSSGVVGPEEDMFD